MPSSWILSSVLQGTNLLVLSMMWMYDRHFLNQTGGRSFRPMIPESSTINLHLFAILEDTRRLSLFSCDELMFILMHHGLMIHLLHRICGITSLTRDTHGRIMRIIMNRVLRYSISHRSCYSQIQVVVKSFYSRIYHPLNISFFLNLIVVLPKPQAILHMSSSGLSDYQMENYEIVALMALFRDLVDRKNRVFSLFYKFVMEEESSESAIRCRQFEKDFRQARRSRDYKVFKKYFEFISKFLFSEIRHPMHSEIRWCLDIMYIFLTKMKNSSSNNWQFFAEVFETKSVDGVFSLLEKGCERFSYKSFQEPFTLKFTLQYPPNQPDRISPRATWLKMNISQALEKAYSFRIPKHLLQILENSSNSYLRNIISSKWSRLLFLLCTFIELVQSNHPHLCFLIDSYIFMKTSQSRCLNQLAIFLNVGHAQEFKLQSFDRLLYRFCNFTSTNTVFSDINERRFIELFDLMMRILSNKNFLDLLSDLLSDRQSINDFIHHLAPRYPQFVTQIFQCRNTYCSECGEFLLPDCTEMCERCAICIHYAQLQNGDHGYSSD